MPQTDDLTIATERPTVCVQGLGFVGAAMSVAVANAQDARGKPCFSVIGLDLPTEAGQQRIDALCRGEFPFGTTDPTLVAAAEKAHSQGTLRATNDPSVIASADIIVVDVPLDVQASSDPPRAATWPASRFALEMGYE